MRAPRSAAPSRPRTQSACDEEVGSIRSSDFLLRPSGGESPMTSSPRRPACEPPRGLQFASARAKRWRAANCRAHNAPVAADALVLAQVAGKNAPAAAIVDDDL